MKKIFYSAFLLLAFDLSAHSQWQRVDLFHLAFDLPYDVEVPNDHTVWASLWNITTSQPYTPYYYRTIDNGANWDYGAVSAPFGYVISSLAAIDEDTCYAIMVDIISGTGGGIFKTGDGGTTWSQLAMGQIFDANSFPDFIYFWNPQEGIAVGDANGPGTPYMEIYTTNDYGATWTRVPRANMPDEAIYGITNSYYVVGDRMWFQATDLSSKNEIWRSDDRGLHWVAFPINVPVTIFNDLAFTDSLNGVVIGADVDGNPFEFITKTGGKNWNGPISYTGDLMCNNVEAIPGTNTLVSTNWTINGPFGSSYSQDNGKTWIRIDEELHSNLKYLNSYVGWSGEVVQDESSTGGMFRWTGLMPVNLTSFTATNTGKSVMLDWTTASEHNNAYFDVERSSNGTSFTQIGRVLGKGNSSQLQSYNYEDLQLQTGKIYYRLKQVDIDGKFTYSKIVSVEIGISATIKISPNPVTSVMKIEGLDAAAKTTLVVYDGSGKIVQKATTTGTNIYTWDVQRLARGTYYLRLQANTNITLLKFVKE